MQFEGCERRRKLKFPACGMLVELRIPDADEMILIISSYLKTILKQFEEDCRVFQLYVSCT